MRTANNPQANSSWFTRIVRDHRSSLLIGAAVVFILGLIMFNLPAAEQKSSSSKQQKVAVDSPPYQTVLPSDRSIKDLGGWKKRTPPQSAAYYDYTDSIDGVKITVSQQALPKSFQANTNERVAQLAKSYHASTKMQVDGQTYYIGASANGPQSVILAKDNLLIFIMSERTIRDQSWKRYIGSLGTPNSTDASTY